MHHVDDDANYVAAFFRSQRRKEREQLIDLAERCGVKAKAGGLHLYAHAAPVVAIPSKYSLDNESDRVKLRIPAEEQLRSASVNHVPALPSLEYLLDCKSPKVVLQSIELACLDQEAQHAKRAKLEMDEARKYGAKAEAARWLIDHLPDMVEIVRRRIDVQAVISFPDKPQAEPATEEVNWRPRYAGAPSTAIR